MNRLLLALALALGLGSSPAFAQAVRYASDDGRSTIVVDSTHGLPVNIVAGSGGGGGGTDGIAQGATTTGQLGVLSQGSVTTAAPTYTTGQVRPLSLETDGDLRVSSASANTILSNILTAAQDTAAVATTIANGSDTTQGALADTVCGTATGTCTGQALQKYANTQLSTIATASAASLPAGSALIGNTGGPETAGSAVTGGGVRNMGKDASGNAQDLRTDTAGGLIGGAMTPTSVRSASLTTSTSTALGGGGATARPSYLKITLESALTANLFLCLNNQTCSATVYDEMLPSGATAGTRLFVETPFTSAVTYYTTATAIVNVTRMGN